MDFVKMVEVFIPTFEYCSLTINFVRTDAIHMFFCDKGYCLFDISADIEHFFQSSDQLIEKAKEFLTNNEVSDVEVNGITGPGPYIYRKK